MRDMAIKTRKWVAWGSILATSIAFGEDYGPCYEAYRTSGPTEQQMSFDEFRAFYSETICVRSEDPS
jgi:hypothetical protein